MKKPIFKAGDKVYCALIGKGVVEKVDGDSEKYPIHVRAELTGKVYLYTADGRRLFNMNPTLSLTEYRLEGFSQERPIDYRDYIGKWGFFGDSIANVLGKLSGIEDGEEEKFITNGMPWRIFKPISEELEAQLRKEGIIE
jgi:hypothetical protein